MEEPNLGRQSFFFFFFPEFYSSLKKRLKDEVIKISIVFFKSFFCTQITHHLFFMVNQEIQH